MSEIHELHITQPIRAGLEFAGVDPIQALGIDRIAERECEMYGWSVVGIRLVSREPWTEPLGELAPPADQELEVLTFLATCSR